MKKIILSLGLWLALLFSPQDAEAQTSQRNPCFYATSTSTGCTSVSGTNPLPVTATATIGGGFTDLTTGTPISVTTGGVTGTLPAGSVVAAFNVGTTNGAYCKLGASATTSDIYLAPNGGWFAFSVGVATQLTCITSTSTTTVNMVGGSGLPTGSGGGAGGSGGGGAVTMASGAVASGAYSAGSLAAGAGVDGWDLTQGAIADAAVTAGATGSVSAKLRSISRDVMTVNTWAGSTLGVMANYGTSPGAVLVPGVNAYVTGSAVGATAGTTSTGALGQMVNCASTTSSSGQSTGNQSYVNCTTNGQLRVTPSYGTTDAVADPCQVVTKTNATGTQTSSTQIISGTSSKKTYICSFVVIAGAAEIINITAGTGSVCGTGTSVVLGSSTASQGLSFAANGGLTLGNGAATVIAATAANADNVCLTQSGSSRVTWQATYVQL